MKCRICQCIAYTYLILNIDKKIQNDARGNFSAKAVFLKYKAISLEKLMKLIDSNFKEDPGRNSHRYYLQEAYRPFMVAWSVGCPLQESARTFVSNSISSSHVLFATGCQCTGKAYAGTIG